MQGTACWLSMDVMLVGLLTMKWSGLLVPAWGCCDCIWLSLAFHQLLQKDILLPMKNQTQSSQFLQKQDHQGQGMLIGKSCGIITLI